VDLISAPPSNSFLRAEQLDQVEAYFPLKAWICEQCWLVQLMEPKSAKEIFSEDYVYFSSYSTSWLEHCRTYTDQMIERFELSSSSKIMEIASNDGYLLQYFAQKGFSVLGIEPTRSTAETAIQKNIPTIVDFFGEKLAQRLAAEGRHAHLIAANNVLAHVPDLNDFIRGIKAILAERGVFTAEFPHLLQLVENNQFDTIYHEHFSYFSLITLVEAFRKQGLRIFDVEELGTHGGSLRIFVDHGSTYPVGKSLDAVLGRERSLGLNQLNYYQQFQEATDRLKNDFLEFLLQAKRSGKSVAGYGAAAKGNTLLNYCGIKPDLIPFVSDASPHKQGRFLPGSHIPVVSEAMIHSAKPDYVIIFPWNLRSEIAQQLSYISEWGGKFVVAIPGLEVF
jgi:SAM-dependent methyltransferase